MSDQNQAANSKRRKRDPSSVLVTTLQQKDVLCGRGLEYYNHFGNNLFRKLIIDSAPEYFACNPGTERRAYLQKVLEIMKSRGSRFLRRHQVEECWIEMSHNKCTDKIRQAFRDISRKPSFQKEKDTSAFVSTTSELFDDDFTQDINKNPIRLEESSLKLPSSLDEIALSHTSGVHSNRSKSLDTFHDQQGKMKESKISIFDNEYENDECTNVRVLHDSNFSEHTNQHSDCNFSEHTNQDNNRIAQAATPHMSIQNDLGIYEKEYSIQLREKESNTAYFYSFQSQQSGLTPISFISSSQLPLSNQSILSSSNYSGRVKCDDRLHNDTNSLVSTSMNTLLAATNTSSSKKLENIGIDDNVDPDSFEQAINDTLGPLKSDDPTTCLDFQ